SQTSNTYITIQKASSSRLNPLQNSTRPLLLFFFTRTPKFSEQIALQTWKSRSTTLQRPYSPRPLILFCRRPHPFYCFLKKRDLKFKFLIRFPSNGIHFSPI
ncbi:hypothetical protein AABB24_011720, partial [Solanum stoloniferum]